MNGLEAMAAFYRSAGKPALCLGGGLWVGETRLSLMAVPGALLVRPQPGELEELLRKTQRLAAVFRCAEHTGHQVNVFVVRDKAYGMHSLQRQFRQQLRSALRQLHCRPMEWEELAARGLEINRDTMARRSLHQPHLTDPGHWKQYCGAGAQVPGHRVMGCFAGEELAAYLVIWERGDMAYGLQMLWSRRHRHLHPTHALYYEATLAQMARPGIEGFTVGRQTLPAMERVDLFKGHAGFRKEACQVGVLLHPALSRICTHPWTLGVLRAVRRRAEERWPRLSHAEVFEVAAQTRLLPGAPTPCP
jgi:hypothetical protein